jgi:heat shock protein HspQ
MDEAVFHVGQLITHLKFGYRGVVFDVDAVYSGDDDWYETMASSRPPKDKPWYHVLVDGSDHTTYVAERHLEADKSGQTITHPMVDAVFSRFEGGIYFPNNAHN